MTLSYKVGENIRISKDRKRKEQGIFAYHRSCSYCTKRKSALFPQLNEAKAIYHVPGRGSLLGAVAGLWNNSKFPCLVCT